MTRGHVKISPPAATEGQQDKPLLDVSASSSHEEFSLGVPALLETPVVASSHPRRPASAHSVKSAQPSPQHHTHPCFVAPKPLLVLKVGTSTIMETSTASFCLSNLGKFVDTICDIKEKGYQVVLVSSGAVGAGVIHMKLKERPTTLQGKQAASAVGQCRMMRLYEDLFSIREIKVGQLILTRTDLMDRTRFINFKQALRELLRLNIVPIINENDSIATAQLRFGDNDTLASYVSVALGAQWLFLLTDVDCLYTANPRSHPDAKPIPYVGRVDDVYKLVDARDNLGTSWGSGGMRTKIVAAQIATATGIHTALCCGKHPERVLDIIAFAETYGQTPEEWEAELSRYQKRKAPLLADSPPKPLAMKISKSEACLQLHKQRHDLRLPDLKGLQHHHYHPHPPSLIRPIPSSNHSLVSSSPSDPCITKANSEGGLDDKSLDSSFERAASCTRTCVQSPPQAKSEHEVPLNTVITVDSIVDMPYLATIFAALECTQKIRDQRRWILSMPVRGYVYIDEGAALAIVDGKKSLFAAGISKVQGKFYANEVVALILDRSVAGSASLASALPSTESLLPISVSSPNSPPQFTLTRCTKTEGGVLKIEDSPSPPPLAIVEDSLPSSSSQASETKTSETKSSSKSQPSTLASHSKRHHHGKHHHGFGNPKTGTDTQPLEQEGEIARCLIDFSSVELDKIKGLRSDKFRAVLGYECDQEVAYRQNIIFVNPCIVYGCSQQHCAVHLPPSPEPQSPLLLPKTANQCVY